MDQLKFKDMNLFEFGHDILVGGVIYSGKEKNYICLLPNESDINDEFCVLDLNTDEWKQIIRQTDLMETEILQKDTDDKFIKAIIRKSTRIIEQGISWRVYKRDNYKCRYCGKDGIPMTVDHLVLWEDGGPSIDENLVTSCRKCNKVRGRIPYTKWLEHPYYKKMSQGLTQEVRDLNIQLINTLDKIPLRVHIKSR